MQLSYRGHSYTAATSQVPAHHQSFEGQFLGIPGTFTTSYRVGVPDVSVPMKYRGQQYLSGR
jgi:hypothetical protein